MPTATESYWETRYRTGGTSGAGSYGKFARFKAAVLNRFVLRESIGSVVEFGCGDGNQLGLARYPAYTGYDISEAAVARCRERFGADAGKRFLPLAEYKGERFDLALSLDVVYHLLEDDIYRAHLRQVFGAATRFAIVYGNGFAGPYPAPHIRLRDVPADIAEAYPDWELGTVIRNPWYAEGGADPAYSWSNFYLYRPVSRSLHPVLRPAPAPRPAGDDPLAHLARSARSALLIAPEPEAAASLLRGNPALGLTVAGDAAALRPALADRAQWLPAIPDAAGLAGFDLLHVGPGGTEALREFGRPQYRALARARAVIAADRAAAAPLLDAAAEAGHVAEIVPPLLGLPSAGRARHWIGAAVAEPQVIVSLTSIRARIAALPRVLETLLAQSVQPDRIVLNLSAEPHLHDAGIPPDALPEALRDLEAQGLLEIVYVPNTGPYRKLLPTLRRFWASNCVIVTADDDTLYPVHWLRGLLNSFRRHGAIAAYRCRKLCIEDGRPLPYTRWSRHHANPEIRPEFRDAFRFPTGKDGVLYAPEFFPEQVFDPALIALAPTADDLVFKLLTLVTRTPVRHLGTGEAGAEGAAEFAEIPGLTGRLWPRNVDENDRALARLLAYLQQQGLLRLADFLLPRG